MHRQACQLSVTGEVVDLRGKPINAIYLTNNISEYILNTYSYAVRHV